MKVSALDSKLIDAVLSLSICESGCDIVSFEDAAGNRQRQGIAEVNSDPSIKLIFTLPGEGGGAVFITASDGDVSLVRRVLASLEAISRVDELNVGNVVPIEDAELALNAIEGVLLLPLDVSNLLRELPSFLELSGRYLKLHLVVFLTREDHGRWLQVGHDGLMDYFTAIDKDLIALGGEVARK